MIKGLFLGIMFFCNLASATYFPNNCYFQLSGRCFTKAEFDALIILYCPVSANNRTTTCRLAGASAGYQATGGGIKIVGMVSVGGVGTTTNAIGSAEPIYGDTDVGYNSVSDPTTPIRIGSFSTALGISMVGLFSALSLSPPINFTVPVNKYPAVHLATGVDNIYTVLYAQQL